MAPRFDHATDSVASHVLGYVPRLVSAGVDGRLSVILKMPRHVEKISIQKFAGLLVPIGSRASLGRRRRHLKRGFRRITDNLKLIANPHRCNAQTWSMLSSSRVALLTVADLCTQSVTYCQTSAARRHRHTSY